MREEVLAGVLFDRLRLNAKGRAAWQQLLESAAVEHDDDWLATELLRSGYLLSEEPYTVRGVTRIKKINQPHAAQQLAEGEFNRYYLRALCLRAMSDGIETLIVCRGKEVSQPRPESEAMIGSRVSASELLRVLRENNFVTLKGVPGGPNSGLTCRLVPHQKGSTA